MRQSRRYPAELEEVTAFARGHVTLRPVRPEDDAEHARFLAQVDARDLRLRFGRDWEALDPAEVAQLTEVDYARQMAFVAVYPAHGGGSEIVGEARAALDPGERSAEFAIVVRTDFQRTGLGRLLLRKLADYYRARGLRYLYGLVAPHNRAMIGLAASLGFDVDVVEGSTTAVVTLKLQQAAVAGG
jgi:GNAT superfamily N-acetyltransferase